MKNNKKSILILTCATAFGIVAGLFIAKANTFVSVGTPATVNGSNVVGAIWSGGVSLPKGTFYIQNSGLTNGVTNCLTGYVQVSVDSNTWINIAQYNPTSTNATVDSFSPYVSPTVYMRFTVVTTNPVPVLQWWSFP